MPGNRSLQLNRTRRSNSLKPVTGSQDSPQTPPVGYEDCERIDHQEASAGAAPEIHVMGALLWGRRKGFDSSPSCSTDGTSRDGSSGWHGLVAVNQSHRVSGCAEPYGVVRVRIPAARAEVLHEAKERDMNWEPIIWAVIWIAGGLAAFGVIAWIVVATFMMSQAKKIRQDFDKGFDSDFFNRNR